MGLCLICDEYPLQKRWILRVWLSWFKKHAVPWGGRSFTSISNLWRPHWLKHSLDTLWERGDETGCQLFEVALYQPYFAYIFYYTQDEMYMLTVCTCDHFGEHAFQGTAHVFSFQSLMCSLQSYSFNNGEKLVHIIFVFMAISVPRPSPTYLATFAKSLWWLMANQWKK